VLGPDAAGGAAVSIVCTHIAVQYYDVACACPLLCMQLHLSTLAPILWCI
jgi:hypothetical protein